MISDEAVQSFIEQEGMPIRLQSGDNPPIVAGWLDWEEVGRDGPAPVMARFLRALADEFDRSTTDDQCDDTTPDDLANVRARAFADGRLAAFAAASDLTPLIASRSGLADPARELHGIASDSDDDTTRERLSRIARAIRGEVETDE